jgi:small subunit ribosomal protein S5
VEYNNEQRPSELEETVIKIYRCAKVVKGGRRFSFAALVVVGDQQGRVGLGYGKANEVPSSVEKGVADAKRKVETVSLEGGTLPHSVVGHFGASKVFMKPASDGTGVIAGASVRAVVEAAGVKNILTKSYGSSNPKNLAKAALEGLRRLRTREQVAKLRGVVIE